MWKPVEKSTQKVENMVQSTLAILTIFTQGEGMNPRHKAELLSFRFYDDSDVVDFLKFIGDMDLRTLFVK